MAYIKIGGVVPYIGTWIETKDGGHFCCPGCVVPYIGTWIETNPVSLSDTQATSYLI